MLMKITKLYFLMALALGFAPTAQAAAAFESVAPVTVLGDAQQPRKILFAVGDAHEAVRKLSGES